MKIKTRNETGLPMLYTDSKRSKSDLKQDLGPNYKAMIKNAKAVLKWADDEYPQSLERTRLGNYPPLIKALDKMGKELQAEYREADQIGSTQVADLKAFEKTAREKVNHLITTVEAEYIEKHGSIDQG